MGTIAVNPPKTPVTSGSSGVAAATVPNVCKMPGPPAPFVPAPLPNIGRSSESPKGYSKKVKFENKPVAIKGATFESKGDVASKGTGGGLVSSNTHGPTKFVGPGSLDVKVEGKNVQLLTDPMLNNCGPSGNPPNSATLAGLLQAAKAKNPANQSLCTGGHTEEVEQPEVPEEEKDVNKRLDKMQEAAVTPEDLFEVAAARHDVARGHITQGNQIGRKGTPSELAAGADPDEQMIWIVCTVCGYRREADQATGNKDTVEAKSTEDALSACPQKAANRARVAAGNTVTYKSPVIRSYQRYAALLEQGFKVVQLK